MIVVAVLVVATIALAVILALAVGTLVSYLVAVCLMLAAGLGFLAYARDYAIKHTKPCPRCGGTPRAAEGRGWLTCPECKGRGRVNR